MKKIIVPFVAIVFLGSAVFFYFQNEKNKKRIASIEQKINTEPTVETKNDSNEPDRTPPGAPSCTSSGTSAVNDPSEKDSNKKEVKIRVSSPGKNEIVKSPLEIRGEASGWYFEGSFPVSIEDENGKILGKANAVAQGEWMTEEYVPFVVRLRFDPGEAGSGKIIFKKDNPSGNPEMDETYELPVKFKEIEGEKLL